MKSIMDEFALSIIMSGTPANYQKQIAKEFPRADYPLYEAVNDNVVCRPTLNIVTAFTNNIPSVITAVYKRELEIVNKENKKIRDDNFNVRIIVNMKSIDDIHSVIEHVRNTIPNCHFIGLHTKKGDASSFIDDKYVKSEDIIEALDNIDDGKLFPNEPVILFQVDMISEGVNIKCFNAAIIQSKSDVKSCQQIGRVVRNYKVGKYDKIHNGHASIYAVKDNESDIVELLMNLAEYELTSDSFKWGSKIDLTSGSSVKEEYDDDDVELNITKWEPLSKIEFTKYIDLFNSARNKQYIKTFNFHWNTLSQKKLILIRKLLKGKSINNGDKLKVKKALTKKPKNKDKIIKCSDSKKEVVEVDTSSWENDLYKKVISLKSKMNSLHYEMLSGDDFFNCALGDDDEVEAWKIIVDICPEIFKEF